MLEIDLSAVLWTVVNLLVLYLLLKRFLFGPVTAIMETRTKLIQDGLDQAQTAQEEAQAMRAQYEEQLARAQQEGSQIVDRARSRGQQEYETLVARAREDAHRTARDAQQQLDAQREEMLRGVRREVASLALLAAAKVSQQAVDEQANRDLVDAFLAEAGERP